MINTVRLDQVPPQPWRNGGGSTHEMLTWPSADAWAVRISVAQIEQNGPFSAYPGIERWFAVVRGEGVVLRFGLAATVQRPDTQPLRFGGVVAPVCELLSGETQDLNLMVRYAAGRGDMQFVTAGKPWLCAAEFRAVYTAAPATLLVDYHNATLLPADTLAWSDTAAEQRWELISARGGTTLRAWWLACADVTSPARPHTH